MQAFQIRRDAFPEIRKKTYRSLGIFIGLAAVIASVSLTTKNVDMDTTSILIYIPVFCTLIGFSIYSSLKRQKQFMEHYRLTIEDNVITREQFNTEELTIYFHEVREIYTNKKGDIFIRGLERTDLIAVSRYIERYDELFDILSAIKPIASQSSDPRIQKLRPFISIFGLVFMIISLSSFDKVVAVITGILAVFFMSWRIYEVRTNKNADNISKKTVWLSLFSILLVIVMIVYKLFSDYLFY